MDVRRRFPAAVAGQCPGHIERDYSGDAAGQPGKRTLSREKLLEFQQKLLDSQQEPAKK